MARYNRSMVAFELSALSRAPGCGDELLRKHCAGQSKKVSYELALESLFRAPGADKEGMWIVGSSS